MRNFKLNLRICAGCLVLAASAIVCLGEDAPNRKDDDATIASLIERGETIIVSTDKGLYQATLKDKQWHKIQTPSAMLQPGKLVQQDPASPLLAFYLRPLSRLEDASGELFISKDSGATWKQVMTACDHHIRDVFFIPNGSLFVCDVVKMFSSETTGARVLWSADMAATWKDITNNLPKDFIFYRLLQDPDHPDLVCVIGGLVNFIRPSPSFVFQAGNSTYQWQKKNMLDWHGDLAGKLYSQGFGGFGNHFIIGSGNSPYVHAKLSNFFSMPFSRTDERGLVVGLLQVETDQPIWSFHADGSKVIPVKVALLQQHAPVKFLDNKDETAFWGLNVMPEGKATIAIQARDWGPPIPEGDKKLASFLNDANLKTVELDDTHPYERNIDLSKFYDFSKPGKYKIQIFHWDESVLKGSGAFGSQVIEVTITP